MECEENSLYKEFSPLFNEYEKIFNSLQKQVDFYKVEHESLKTEIVKLVNENKTLSLNLDELLHSKATNTNNNKDTFENDTIKYLRSQLTLISQEKDTTFDLWQNALQTIDHLETELRYYRGDNNDLINKTTLVKEKQKHTSEIKELQKKLKTAINQLEDKNKHSFDNLEQKSNELILALEGQRTALNQIKEKDAEIAELTGRVNNLLHTCNHLESEIGNRETVIKNLVITEQESRAKVLESVILIEAAISDKNSAICREQDAKEEIEELNKSLSEIIKQADEKMKSEIDLVKKQYNENLNKLLEDMKSVQNNLNDKNLQLEKVTRECKMMEEEMSRMKKGNIIIDDSNISKLLILEKNLESTFQKLLLSERRNVQITAERDSVKMDLDQMANSFERDRKTNEIEKQNLERKIKTLQNELAISNGFVEEYVVQIKELNSRMMDMEKEIKEKIDQKDKMFEEILFEKINKVQSENSAVQNEMHRHLKSEHNLNKRWKTETIDIVRKLQERIKDLKHENAQLKKDVDNFQ